VVVVVGTEVVVVVVLDVVEVVIVVVVVVVVVVESRGESEADAGMTRSPNRIPALSEKMVNRRCFMENSGK
jgi:hypothetical protein